jgi:hypothetical protein
MQLEKNDGNKVITLMLIFLDMNHQFNQINEYCFLMKKAIIYIGNISENKNEHH